MAMRSGSSARMWVRSARHHLSSHILGRLQLQSGPVADIHAGDLLSVLSSSPSEVCSEREGKILLTLINVMLRTFCTGFGNFICPTFYLIYIMHVCHVLSSHYSCVHSFAHSIVHSFIHLFFMLLFQAEQ